MKNTARHLLLASLLALLAAAPAARAQYTFTLIADSDSSTFNAFTYAPSINAAGTVAFGAELDSFGTGIFTGAGGLTIAIALSSEPTFSEVYAPSINAAGTVAFLGELDAGGGGIFTGAGGATTTIALSSETTFASVGSPSINTAGTVAFAAFLYAGGQGVFTVTGGTTTSIALSSDPTFSGFSHSSINAAGTVAFVGYLDAGGYGVFTGAGGETTPIALSSGPPFSGFNFTAINTAGTVAFSALFDGDGGGIFTGAGGPTTAIRLDVAAPPSINTAGAVAFLDSAIYVSEGGALTPVIFIGEELFGSTVSDLGFGSTGLNDAGQLAFRYTLEDGRSGIAVASVPEPGCALLSVLGGAALLARRRNAQRRHA